MTRVRIKICGVTHPDDVRAAADAGADAVGFNFYPNSPRFVAPTAAAALVRATPPFVEPVGVFVEASAEEMRATASRLGLRAVQWHGDGLPPAEDVSPYPLIVAGRVRGPDCLAGIRQVVAERRAAGVPFAAVLIDAHVPGQFGGTGRPAPWDLLAGFDPGVPVILAGGLTPANVAEAVRIVRPWGVDVASGVESSPGRKDPDKLRRFAEAVRAAEG
ncbi:MAG TPA: phosphoribosylanthranilate isomerase [Gemmataceae bacterium]|jgi:phosphoribosylanthranilate isomerase